MDILPEADFDGADEGAGDEEVDACALRDEGVPLVFAITSSMVSAGFPSGAKERGAAVAASDGDG